MPIYRLCTLLITLLLLPCLGLAKAGWEAVDGVASVVKFRDSYGVCTGTRISNEGHILTARHCFNACLIQNKWVDTIRLFPEFGWQSPNLYKFRFSAGATCELMVDGQSATVEIHYASSGFMTPSEQRSLLNYEETKYYEMADLGYLHNGDFAVVKVVGDDRKDCRKTAKSQISSLGASVRYFGYPAQSTGRPDKRNSDGERLYKGVGQTINTILKNSCIKNHQAKDRLTKIYDRNEVLLSTVDVLPGASGSSLLNGNNEIVALINSTYSHGVDVFSQYCSGSTVSVKISLVKEKVKEALGESYLKQAFDCQ